MKIRILLSLCLLSAVVSNAETLLVPSQYPTIQAGIDASSNGDTVLVADGIYTGAGNRDMTFGGRIITLLSKNGPERCKIDCEEQGRAFTFDNGETQDAVLEGFTMMNGNPVASGGAINIINNSSPTIKNCIFFDNDADSFGGAISCEDSEARIIDCRFYDNTVVGCGNWGGGIRSQDSALLIEGCVFQGNLSTMGAAIYLAYSQGEIHKCTITSNAVEYSQELYIYHSTTEITNIIVVESWNGRGCVRFDCAGSASIRFSDFWGDPNQIYLGTPPPGFSELVGLNANGDSCDVYGNIFVDPCLVDTLWHDSRLLWGSPCIDAGEAIWSDPDGTPSDIGAHFFDQREPVKTYLTPHGYPLTVIPGGGTFHYTLRLTNITSSPVDATLWFDVTLPNGSMTDPLLGPAEFTLQPDVMTSRFHSQFVPASVPGGFYDYNVYSVTGADTMMDRCVVFKMGGNEDICSSDWQQPAENTALEVDNSPKPDRLDIAVSPNPFNPSTVISFDLPEIASVELAVYDVAGRNVELQYLDHLQPGYHTLTFSGSHLPSGIYYYRLTAGEYTGVGKMVLLK